MSNMRTPITLQEFLFTLNQDEDCRVILTDFNALIAETLFIGWKSSLYNSTQADNFKYENYKDWYVQDFVLAKEGLEITIVKSEEELD